MQFLLTIALGCLLLSQANSSFISEGLGYYYKKFTMTLWLSADALDLWNQMERDESNPVHKPADWDERRFELAKLSLDFNLLYVDFTREQHKKGADFAYRIFLEN